MDKEISRIETMAMAGLGELSPEYGVWDWDLGGGVIYADEIAARIFGVNPITAKRGIAPEVYFAAIHEGDRCMIMDHSNRSIATNGACADNFRLVLPTGTKWVHSQGRAFPDRDNKPRSFVGLVTEVTDPSDFEVRGRAGFHSGGVSDDILYLCLHAKRIAAGLNRPFLNYLLEMAIDEVSELKVLNRC